jgi:hypothetical protein
MLHAKETCPKIDPENKSSRILYKSDILFTQNNRRTRIILTTLLCYRIENYFLIHSTDNERSTPSECFRKKKNLLNARNELDMDD